jgi:hypothetical protein
VRLDEPAEGDHHPEIRVDLQHVVDAMSHR